MRFWRSGSRFRSDLSGVATVEFAFALPMLIVCVSGVANVTHRIAVSGQVQSAAEAGVRVAGRSGFDQTRIAQAIVNDQPGTGITANPAPSQQCRCFSSHGLISTVLCTAKCINGKDPSRYAVVSATVAYGDPFPLMKLNDETSITVTNWTRLK